MCVRRLASAVWVFTFGYHSPHWWWTWERWGERKQISRLAAMLWHLRKSGDARHTQPPQFIAFEFAAFWIFIARPSDLRDTMEKNSLDCNIVTLHLLRTKMSKMWRDTQGSTTSTSNPHLRWLIFWTPVETPSHQIWTLDKDQQREESEFESQ